MSGPARKQRFHHQAYAELTLFGQEVNIELAFTKGKIK